MKRFAGWTLASPATALVVIFLVLPVLATIATTFTTPAGPFATYLSFFGSGFRRTVLFRTIQISLATTAIALVIGFLTAYVVARSPGWLKSILIIAAVFPLLTGVVVRSFAWLIILGKNGILNSTLIQLGLIGEPITMLYTPGAVIVAMVYLFVPLMILTLVGVLESIPEDLIQASASLGANPVATFIQVTLPLAVPGLALALALLQLYGTMQGFRTSWTFILVGHVLYTLPFMVRAVLAVMMAMDLKTLEEGAASLGAGPWARFRDIVVPNAMPGILAGALTVVTLSVGEFNLTWMLHTPYLKTLPVGLADSYASMRLEVASAYTLVFFVLIVPLLVAMQWASQRAQRIVE